MCLAGTSKQSAIIIQLEGGLIDGRTIAQLIDDATPAISKV